MTKPNDAAFPTGSVFDYDGTTKRELFAALAFLGLLASGDAERAESMRAIAKRAEFAADQFIAVLNENREAQT